MSDMDGNIVKIVDRSVFSANNRDDDIISGFNHNESLNEEINCFKTYSEGVIDPSDNALSNKFRTLLEGNNKTAVVAFGRFNPPTIGHLKLVNKMREVANMNLAEPLLYLSHSHDSTKNPLDYDEKYKWVDKAFGHTVKVVKSDLRNIIVILNDLYKNGYRRIIYIGGDDRIGGSEDISRMILKYNGQPTKEGEIMYDFDSIDFESAGTRNDHSDDISEQAAASLARKYVKEDNFERFKEIVPFSEEDAKELFNKLKGVS